MVSLSNLQSAIARLVAENAIQSDETNHLIHDAAKDAAEASLDQANKAKEMANAQREAAAVVEMASSAVNVARQGASVGKAVSEYRQQEETEPRLTQATDRARSTDTDTSRTGMDELLDTRLGDGRRVGERFSGDQVRGLLRRDLGARTGESREAWNARVGQDLRRAGFGEGEVDQIWDRAKDGRFDTKDAVDFIWANRRSPEEVKRDQVREKIIDAIQQQTTAFVGRTFGDLAKKSQGQAKSQKDLAGRNSDIGGRALDLAVEHNKRLGDLELDGLRKKRTTHAASAAKTSA